ncbi:MAG TPA: hypothetical protein VII94_00695 [Candidatus Saccharimonadales bacterium]
MKRPYVKLHPVHEWNYKKRTADIVIYQAYKNATENNDYCPHCSKKTCSGQCLNEYAKEGYMDQPKIPNTSLHKMTLQSLLDMLPEGVKPSDVKIEMINHDWAGVPYSKLVFSYRKTFPADMKRFKIDKAAYDVEWAEYEKKAAAFKEWETQQEMKLLQDKIAALKK